MTISNDSFDYFVPTIEDITFVQSDHCFYQSNNINVDEGINYGLSFFETILVLDHPIFLTEHIGRLNSSLHHFHIKTKITKELVLEIITLCHISNKGLKIIVSESNIIVSIRSLTYTNEYYEQGAKVMLSNITRSSYSYLINHKSTNYGDMILSLRNAHDLGYNDCLFCNENGYLTESTIANLFIIKNNQLITSSTNQGLLPGIVRNYLIKTYNIIERTVSIDDLVYADAAFLTNSLVGIIRISRINFNKTIIDYTQHPLIQSITNDYNLHIRN